MNTKLYERILNEPKTCIKVVILSLLFTFLSGHTIAQNGEFNHNYIRTFTPIRNNATQLVPVHNGPGDFYTRKWSEQIVYYDGLGRELQIVNVHTSNSEMDIITPIDYDEFGRKTKDYLPYARQNSGVDGPGGYRKNFDTEIKDYYYSIHGSNNANYAFAEKDMEESPLNRLLEQSAPGYTWRLEAGRTIAFKYGTNQVLNEVFKFSVSPNNQLKKEGCYLNGKLLKNTYIDENGNQSVEYTDYSNHLVQKKVFDGTAWLITIYAYDNFGLLRYVLPPESFQHLPSGNSYQTFTSETDWILDYCYYYVYDDRKRMIIKRLPGKEEEYLVYNERDQLIMTQDGNQRSGDTRYWTFFRYDALGRQVMTGRISDGENRSRAYMQEQADNLSGLHLNPDLNGEHGYSGDGIPPPDPGSQIEVFTIMYYDNYKYIDKSEFEGRYAFRESDIEFLYPKDENVKGKVTSTKTTIIRTEGMDGNASLPDWIISAMYYDINGNLIQAVSDNHIQGFDIVSMQVNFTGQILRQKEFQIAAFGSTSNNHVVDHYYTYNHTGRLIEEKHKIDDGELVTLAINGYDELGLLKNKKLHSISNKTEVQKLDYSYNIRNWLTDINHLSDQGNDLFVMRLRYNDADIPQFNGNIGSMEYKYPTDNVAAQYDFTYDKVSRLTAAISGNDRYTCSYNYDKNGNITDLQRKGYTGAASPDDPENGVGGGDPVGNFYSAIDKLEYTYDGNRLKAVDDYESFNCQQNGFSDNGSFDKVEYFYDANGNMIADRNKQITSIIYNHLNLPTKIVMGLQKEECIIYYLYDATGKKLRKQTQEGRAIVNTTDYTGNYVYKDSELEFVHTSEGRVVPDSINSEEFEYQYYLKDHLGNNRILFNENGDVLQSDCYYPFGMRMDGMFDGTGNGSLLNKYLYNGKELQDDFGLDWYDFRFRMYDPALGRFTCLDPIAEDFHWVSPYNYAENSPISNIDLWGLQAYYAADGSVLGQVGTSTEIRAVNSTLTNTQATTLIEGSRAPLLGSGDAQQQLLDKSTTFVDYAENVNDVLNDAPLETWADNGQNCYTAAKEQMDNAGQSTENKYSAIQTDVNNTLQPANQQLTENTVGGAINIMTELKAGNPVMVGVKEVGNGGNVVNVGNYNKNTGHFVVVSSMQKNGSNTTFGYYDNANGITGKSTGNRFSVNNASGIMQDNTSVGVGGVQSYTISEVRKNKP